MVFIIGCASATAVMAEDIIESEGTRIIGDSDMPKALYIVPWRRSALPTLSGRSIAPFVDDALAPMSRELLIIQMQSHQIFQASNISLKGDR